MIVSTASKETESFNKISSLTNFYYSVRFGDPNEPVRIPALLLHVLALKNYKEGWKRIFADAYSVS